MNTPLLAILSFLVTLCLSSASWGWNPFQSCFPCCPDHVKYKRVSTTEPSLTDPLLQTPYTSATALKPIGPSSPLPDAPSAVSRYPLLDPDSGFVPTHENYCDTSQAIIKPCHRKARDRLEGLYAQLIQPTLAEGIDGYLKELGRIEAMQLTLEEQAATHLLTFLLYRRFEDITQLENSDRLYLLLESTQAIISHNDASTWQWDLCKHLRVNQLYFLRDYLNRRHLYTGKEHSIKLEKKQRATLFAILKEECDQGDHHALFITAEYIYRYFILQRRVTLSQENLHLLQKVFQYVQNRHPYGHLSFKTLDLNFQRAFLAHTTSNALPFIEYAYQGDASPLSAQEQNAKIYVLQHNWLTKNEVMALQRLANEVHRTNF